MFFNTNVFCLKNKMHKKSLECTIFNSVRLNDRVSEYTVCFINHDNLSVHFNNHVLEKYMYC